MDVGPKTTYVGPKITYIDDFRAKVTSDSRENVLAWWLANRFETFHNQLVSDRNDAEPHTCFLRVRLQHEISGLKIQTILQEAGIFCEESPPENLVTFLLQNQDKIFKIGGNSYQIISLISDRGAFGDVFLARDLKSKTKVVIKILRDSSDNEHFILRRLKQNGPHPNIVHYIGDEIFYGKRWIVMEYIQGEPVEWTEELREQYKSALQFIEQTGVQLQRENERDNVMMTLIDGKPTLKLIDFGTLARK